MATIIGTAGNDNLGAAVADDIYVPLAGDDTIDGGQGFDRLHYSTLTGGVTVSLAAGSIATTTQGTDSYSGIEFVNASADLYDLTAQEVAEMQAMGFTSFVIGTDFGDTLVGNSTNNDLEGQGGDDSLQGGGGDDFLTGHAGNDTLNGGTGSDWVAYDDFSIGSGVTVNLTSGQVTGPLGTDTLISIENVEASPFDDTLTGSAKDNQLNALEGHDTLDGKAGNDTMIGGMGNDTYIVAEAGDVVTELSGEGTDTVKSSITYMLTANVEALTLTGTSDLNGTGNALANTVTGNNGMNVLNGGGGKDTLNGAAGNDTLIWHAQDGKVNGGGSTDTLKLNGAGVLLDLTVIANTKIVNVEIINVTGSGNNTLTLNFQDVLDISATTNTLRVAGNAGDTVNAGGGWTQGVDQVIGANTYESYTQGAATLLVDTDVTGIFI